MIARASLSLSVIVMLAVGCSRPVEIPAIDPTAVTSRALDEYDHNKDGFLDASELERCPGLKAALPSADKDRDGRFSRDELHEYFSQLAQSKTGLQQVLCRVTLDKKPLAGATITLEPEAFMGGKVKPAKGTTDDRGEARFQIEGAPQPGCNLGVYRVRITKAVNGTETLAERYNTRTQLGIEVSPSMRGRTVFSLDSR